MWWKCRQYDGASRHPLIILHEKLSIYRNPVLLNDWQALKVSHEPIISGGRGSSKNIFGHHAHPFLSYVFLFNRSIDLTRLRYNSRARYIFDSAASPMQGSPPFDPIYLGRWIYIYIYIWTCMKSSNLIGSWAVWNCRSGQLKAGILKTKCQLRNKIANNFRTTLWWYTSWTYIVRNVISFQLMHVYGSLGGPVWKCFSTPQTFYPNPKMFLNVKTFFKSENVKI